MLPTYSFGGGIEPCLVIEKFLLLSFGLVVLALASVILNLDMEMDPKIGDYKALIELLPLILVTCYINLPIQHPIMFKSLIFSYNSVPLYLCSFLQGKGVWSDLSMNLLQLQLTIFRWKKGYRKCSDDCFILGASLEKPTILYLLLWLGRL
ncbi:phosphate transporter PHO1-like protein 7-like [Gossypium australe]|uniref:Phosphate transporter PHO1-like protein 7-like n=1 Tax=Gossypium australe TaxID=47621 RepID=A0A5B6VDQ6_9ROSI|nr:phosphate transporter PHO1-like protein 7-like [Gossypium australe]